VCHAVRAPGSNVTSTTLKSDEDGAAIASSSQTVPLKYSAGPRFVAAVLVRVMIIAENPPVVGWTQEAQVKIPC
jgi:hypothetical protein